MDSNTSMVPTNSTEMGPRITGCINNEPNPWYGQFGVQQYFEILFLSTVMLLGVFGNFLVIGSLVYAKAVLKTGNIFIINLAVADIIVTGIFTPTVISNVIHTENSLSIVACQVFGYLIIAGCSVSMWSLALIALNRYWAIAKHSSYLMFFSNKRLYLCVLLVWVWANLLVIPAWAGWSTLLYDCKAMVCAYDDQTVIGYNILLMSGAILFPLGLTIFSYWKLFRHVRWSRRNIKNILSSSESQMKQNRLKKEMNLMKTLATTVAVFILCWTPYSCCVLFDPVNIAPLAKKICTWLGLLNSAVNFIIYGVMNTVFRKAYRNFLCCLFNCFRCKCGEAPVGRTNSSAESAT